MQAKNIKKTLNALIKKAAWVDADLEARLRQIDRWIKDIKPGTLVTKKFVLLFLIQIINDATVLLILKGLSDPQDKQMYYDSLTPTERYWYEQLFPRWLNQDDPKFNLWRQKLMAGDFNQQDSAMMTAIINEVENRGGTVFQRYIADFSMATDLIVSYFHEKALCVQVTTLSQDFYLQKHQEWKNTLQGWEIERGLFLSYNPAQTDLISKIANVLIFNSDHLTTNKYLRFDL